MITTGIIAMGLKQQWKARVYAPCFQRVSMWIGAVALTTSHSAIASGTDLLKGTFPSSLNGIGINYVYALGGILALALYFKTRNTSALVGVVTVVIFIHIVIKLVGVS